MNEVFIHFLALLFICKPMCVAQSYLENYELICIKSMGLFKRQKKNSNPNFILNNELLRLIC